ncbi:putative cyclic pyranopterin monophosphate synthase [Dirofilaria immitis]
MEQLESDSDILLPLRQPILASQKFPHMLSMSKPSSFKISPSSTGKSTRIAGRKRTTTNKSRKKAKNITAKSTSRALPVNHSRRKSKQIPYLTNIEKSRAIQNNVLMHDYPKFSCSICAPISTNLRVSCTLRL